MRIKEMIATMFAVFVILIFSDIAEIRAENQVALQALQEAKELKDWHKFDEAIAAYRNIVSSYSGTDEADQAQIEIGNIYAERGMFDEAIKEYQKVIGQYSPQIKRSMASLQAASSSKEAQPIDAKKYPGLEKTAVVHRANEGVIYSYLETNRYDKAMEALQEEIRTNSYSKEYAQFQIESLQQEIEKRKREEPEKEKIRILLKKLEQAYNTKNLDLLKECYTPEGYGNRLQDIKRYFDTHEKVNMSIVRSLIRFQGKNQAVVEYFSIFKEEPSDGIIIDEGEGYCNRLLIKENGEWRIK